LKFCFQLGGIPAKVPRARGSRSLRGGKNWADARAQTAGVSALWRDSKMGAADGGRTG